MNHRSVGPRYEEIFVSKAIRSLFSSRTVEDAAVGGLAMMCHQFELVFGEGVAGSEFRLGPWLLVLLGPAIVRVSMWMTPQRMSTCRANSALEARSRRDWRVVSKACAVSWLRGR